MDAAAGVDVEGRGERGRVAHAGDPREHNVVVAIVNDAAQGEGLELGIAHESGEAALALHRARLRAQLGVDIVADLELKENCV